MGVKACPKKGLGGLVARGKGNSPPPMLNFEPLDGLEKFQSRGVCRCWGLRLRRVRGICECESLLLKISRRVRGQGGARGRRKTPQKF